MPTNFEPTPGESMAGDAAAAAALRAFRFRPFAVGILSPLVWVLLYLGCSLFAVSLVCLFQISGDETAAAEVLKSEERGSVTIRRRGGGEISDKIARVHEFRWFARVAPPETLTHLPPWGKACSGLILSGLGYCLLYRVRVTSPRWRETTA